MLIAGPGVLALAGGALIAAPELVTAGIFIVRAITAFHALAAGPLGVPLERG